MVSHETANKKHPDQLSKEFIAGVISVAGSFTHTNTARISQFGFQIKLPTQNHILLDLIRQTLGLKMPVKIYSAGSSEYALLISRSKKELNATIIPFCNEHLLGYKVTQFIEWKEKFINSSI